MMRTQAIRIILFVLLVVTADTAHAESVLWGADVGSTLYHMHADGSRCVPMLGSAHADVSYTVTAVNVSTGMPVCGATVAKGTRIAFRFSPHTSNDVYWFGTGYAWDSPYGDWGANASYPAGQNICLAKNYYTATGEASLYGDLVVNPPVQALSGLSGFTCTADVSGNQTCTADTVGSFSPVFSFGATYGKWYTGYVNGSSGGATVQCSTDFSAAPLESVASAYWPQDGTGWRYCSGNQPFVLQVPAQQISCAINVENATGAPPGNPILTVAEGSACAVGTPYTLSFSATDPDGDAIRYAVDWNNDGFSDQLVPAVGTSPSGTVLTASRTYVTAGTKTVRVMAIDSHGNASGWATKSFSCAGSDLGDDTVVIMSESGGSREGDDATAIPQSSDLELHAAPSLLHSGATTRVNWSAAHMTSCVVSSPTGIPVGQTWNTLLSAVGGNMSAPISGPVTFTLSCIGTDGNTYQKNALVNIVPSWTEQ